MNYSPLFFGQLSCYMTTVISTSERSELGSGNNISICSYLKILCWQSVQESMKDQWMFDPVTMLKELNHLYLSSCSQHANLAAWEKLKIFNNEIVRSVTINQREFEPGCNIKDVITFTHRLLDGITCTINRSMARFDFLKTADSGFAADPTQTEYEFSASVKHQSGPAPLLHWLMLVVWWVGGVSTQFNQCFSRPTCRIQAQT